MSLEDYVNSFRTWATNLGCPPEAIPTEEALKSLFKSRQRDLFHGLMRRVKPKQEVQEIRENILVAKMEKFNDQLVPTRPNFLPKEIQSYLEIQDLNKHKAKVDEKIKEHVKESDTLAAAIKTKNIQAIGLENKKENLHIKINLLNFKLESLEETIKKEEKNKIQILASMPVKLTEKNANDAAAMNCVQQALKELDAFYNLFLSHNSSQLKDAKDELWKKMRQIFSNTPNFLIFNAVMRLKEKQLQDIMSLNKKHLMDVSKDSPNCGGTNKEPLTPFELKLIRTKVDFIGIVAKYVEAYKEHSAWEERYANKYTDYVNELQKNLCLYNSNIDEDYIDEAISNYMIQYSSHIYSKSLNEFLAQQIEMYEEDTERNAKLLDNHEILLGSVKEIYNEINVSVNRIQHEMIQLNQIKEKIIYSKNIMKRLLDEMQFSSVTMTPVLNPKSSFMATKIKVNQSFSAVEGFELGNPTDIVFSSTKLDFDTSVASNSTILKRSFGMEDGRFSSLPAHLTELNTFVETPVEKINAMSKNCAYFIAPNPWITEILKFSSTLQLTPGTLLTPFGAIQEVRNRIKWADLIAEQSSDLKLDLDLITVDPNLLKERIKEQHERITELLDKIDAKNITTRHTLQKISNIYKFILDNPLRYCIPATKRFGNRTYAEYEGEYNMYYRIARGGDSKN